MGVTGRSLTCVLFIIDALHNRRKLVIKYQFFFFLPSALFWNGQLIAKRIVDIEPGHFVSINHPAVLAGEETDISGSF